MTEIEKGCEYCKDYDSTPIIDKGNHIEKGLTVCVDGECGVLEVDNDGNVWYSNESAQIRFCPMCGRKLNKDA